MRTEMREVTTTVERQIAHCDRCGVEADVTDGNVSPFRKSADPGEVAVSWNQQWTGMDGATGLQEFERGLCDPCVSLLERFFDGEATPTHGRPDDVSPRPARDAQVIVREVLEAYRDDLLAARFDRAAARIVEAVAGGR